jgi:hypothetical protein
MMEATRIVLSEHERSTLQRRRRRRLIARADATRAEIVLLAADGYSNLVAAIQAFIDACNASPRAFRWVKTADDILASIERFCRRTLDVHAKPGWNF